VRWRRGQLPVLIFAGTSPKKKYTLLVRRPAPPCVYMRPPRSHLPFLTVGTHVRCHCHPAPHLLPLLHPPLHAHVLARRVPLTYFPLPLYAQQIMQFVAVLALAGAANARSSEVWNRTQTEAAGITWKGNYTTSCVIHLLRTDSARAMGFGRGVVRTRPSVRCLTHLLPVGWRKGVVWWKSEQKRVLW
jgi:hypothetical protein